MAMCCLLSRRASETDMVLLPDSLKAWKRWPKRLVLPQRAHVNLDSGLMPHAIANAFQCGLIPNIKRRNRKRTSGAQAVLQRSHA
jgi:hypothetical protein